MKRVIVLGLVVLALAGCGDQKAKDRASELEAKADLSRAQAEAYEAKRQADALATAVAVNAESQQIAMSAMATQAALANQYTALTLQPEPAPTTDGSTGFDLADVLPWAMLGLTVGSVFVSVVLMVAATRRPAPQPRVVYVAGGERGSERVRLLEPQQLFLRPLPPGQSQRARLLRDGRGT